MKPSALRSLALVPSLVLLACAPKGPDAAATPDAAVAPPSGHDHAPAAPTAAPAPTAPEKPPPANEVQAEMRILDAVMRDVLTMIANNELAGVPDKIFSVHGARAATEKAIAEKRYLPPRPEEGIEAFIATDNTFHDELVRLVRAAKANDLMGATAAYTSVVMGCTSCHQRFRFPKPPAP